MATLRSRGEVPVERSAGHVSVVDVLDRVLDKGIVIDAWVRVSLVGIDLVSVKARAVVASIDTYIRHADALSLVTPVATPAPPRIASRGRAPLAARSLSRVSADSQVHLGDVQEVIPRGNRAKRERLTRYRITRTRATPT